MSDLNGQVAVITGGSSGIGLAIAAVLLAEGMTVAITAREPKRLGKAAEALRAKGGRVIAMPTDVSQASEVSAFVNHVKDEVGRIDLLVNNAGIFRLGKIADLSEADWDAVQDINLKGAFLCTKAVLPIMKKQHSGYVVNISSVAGKTGFGEASAYCASKFGLIGLTESLLEEGVKEGIRATAICPGYVATPMVAGVDVPQSEMIPPEDIAKVVQSLLHLSPLTVIREIVVNRVGSVDG
ncbi:3-oxoacyl-[acyl-carrier protein] reductase [hydrothermal vent metagenome]|uniref:3-oxoacyl-[acyl-carrier protein] reductase n=1 Tax=hydrothermal vent metagenome TaxID=652676 RepID=A0A3B1DUY2_9ZZZZ